MFYSADVWENNLDMSLKKKQKFEMKRLEHSVEKGFQFCPHSCFLCLVSLCVTSGI